MSRLVGICNSTLSPDHAEHWLWRATDIPQDPRWDYERLNVECLMAEGNLLFRVQGGATERIKDGVFLNTYFNPDLKPQVVLADGQTFHVEQSLEPAPAMPFRATEPVISRIPERETVASPEIADESQSARMRRKAIALRWQANQLEEAAEKLCALEAQGLI